MLGIGYESSDEDEPIPVPRTDLTNTRAAPLEQPAAAAGPVSGPSQGPAVSPPPQEDSTANDAPPGSPYTASRAIAQNLTLPTVPNFDIPPSPPGSPPPRATQKFAQFLRLKSKGQHFNQRLEGSSVLRDPGHLPRLLEFAGVSEEDQYASALSEAVAHPAAFPEWAYAEELKASQRTIFKAREQQKSKVPRDAVDFVSATKPVTASAAGTPSYMSEKRKELEHRSRDSSQSRSRPRSRSKSPKRRRSRSKDKR